MRKMITTEDIKNLAKLARIEINPAEEESLTKELDSILGYVGQITSSTERERGSTEPSKANVRNVMREDLITNTSRQYTKEILENAPSKEGNYIKVKKIL